MLCLFAGVIVAHAAKRQPQGGELLADVIVQVQGDAPPLLFLHRDELFEERLDALERLGALVLEPPLLGDVDDRREQPRCLSAALHAGCQAQQFPRRPAGEHLHGPRRSGMPPAAGEEIAQQPPLRRVNGRGDRQPIRKGGIEPEQGRSCDVRIVDLPASTEGDEADRGEVVQIGVA